MKHKIMDSNAPPQSRGNPQCMNAYPDSTRLIGTDRPQKRAYRMHECVNAGFRGRYHTPVISTKSLSRFIGKKSVTTAFKSNRFLPREPGFEMSEVGRGYRIAGGARAVSAKVPAPGLLFRPTGRDGPVLTSSSGPPGSSQMIFGVPVWLEEEGRGEGKEQRAESRELRAVARGKPPEASGKQLTARGKEQRAESRELREVARGKEQRAESRELRAVARGKEQRAESRELRALASGKPLVARSRKPVARGKPLTARGKPLAARGQPPEVEYDVFHRANLPELGEVCTGNRGIEQVNHSHQLNSNTVPLATFTC